MLIDMHVHVGYDSRITIRQAVESARRAGVDAICAVEHDQIIPRKFVTNTLEHYAMPVFRALEASSPFGDFLVYGIKNFSVLDVERDAIVSVLESMLEEFRAEPRQRINMRDLIWFPSYQRLRVLTTGLGASIAQVIRTTHEQGGLIYWAHPFRPVDNPFLWTLYTGFTADRGLSPSETRTMERFLDFIHQEHPDLLAIMQEVDGLETINGKHARTPDMAICNRLAATLAEILQKPATGGSDAHRIDVVGDAVTEFSEPLRSENELVSALRERRMRPRLNGADA